MPWWGWITLGILLMGAELVAVDAAFYLVFVGAAALCIGILGLGGMDLPVWGQYLSFAALAITSMVLFREKLYVKLRGSVPGFRDTRVGRTVTVDEDVPEGGETRVALRGTQWTAVNRGPGAIAAGSGARIVKTDGVELVIESLPAERPASG